MASTGGIFSTVPTRPNGATDIQPANTSSQSSVDKSNTTLREQQAGAPANNGSSASGEDFDTDFELQLQGTTGSDWTQEELAILEGALSRFPADKYPPVERYIHVAASLPSKTARDVALRVQACGLDDKSRRGPLEDSAKRKAGGGPPTRTGMQQGGKGSGAGAPGASGTGASGSGDDASPSVPSVLTQLMEQNYTILTQFKSNMASFKVMENTELLVRYRDNLLAIHQQLGSIGGTMGQMPPLPVQPNFDLANKFLPPAAIKPQVPTPTTTAPPAAVAAAAAAVAAAAAASMPGVSMAVAGASPTGPSAPSAVGLGHGAASGQPAIIAPTPVLPMMPSFPFNTAAAPGLGQAPGMHATMQPMQMDWFGAAAGMPGAMGVMPSMMAGGLNPAAAAAAAAAMGAGMAGAQFPFPMGAPGMMGCMPMAAGAMAVPPMPDAGVAAAAAAAAVAAATQQAAMPAGMSGGMTAVAGMSRQGSAVQPMSIGALPVTVKQESGS